MTASPLTADLESRARKRAAAKIGWYTHASIYILVNLFLAFLSARSSHAWALFPALGWGLGLLIHGVRVWLAPQGGALHASLLERERQALRRQNPG